MKLNDVPHGFEFDAEIVMNQHIAHARDLTPRNFWNMRSCFARQLFDRFADDLQISDHGVLSLGVGKKRFAPISGIGKNSPDGILNVQ